MSIERTPGLCYTAPVSSPPFEDPRRVLSRYGFAPKKKFSQNFLTSQHVVDRIAEAVLAEPGATVLEIGPGLGTLTAALLRRGLKVVALERDPDMAHVVTEEFGRGDAPQVTVQPGDATQLDLEALMAAHPSLGERLYLAGNLPYAITGPIFRALTAQADRVAQAVVMIQKEVRDRLLAEPGNKTYGALTVFATARYDITPVLKVPAGAFHPPPKVESAVIAMRPRETPLATLTPAFTQVVRAAFDARRKTLRNALKPVASRAELDVDQWLEQVGIDGRLRGETLSVSSFDSLAKVLASAAPLVDADGGDAT